MVPRNFDAAELLQMRRKPLRIEQREFPSTQMFDQCHQCDLRCIGHTMKHRFAKECAADRDAIKSAGELAAGPRFDRMGITKLMQTRVTLDDLAIDPCVVTRRASLDHLRESIVDLGFESLLAQEPAKGMRYVKILHRQDRTRVG